MRAVVLLLLPVLSLPGCIEDTEDTATHRWSAAIHPEDGGPWEIELPFLIAVQDRALPPLEALREQINVLPGSLQIDWLDHPEGHLHIRGQGPATLEAHRTFRGDVGEREAFLDWHAAGGEVRSLAGGALNITWSVDHSGGTGHTCWQRGMYEAELPAQGKAWLRDSGLPGPRGILREGVPAVCA